MSTINVVVVDDDWKLIKPLLKECEDFGFAFSGVSEFSVNVVMSEVEEVKPSVLLLDIIHAGQEQAGRTESGIRLFEELGKNKKWKKLSGSVQIVFFSAEPSAQRHALIGGARRVDVSGFVSKTDLLEKKPEALGILQQAAKLASMYVRCPELADPALRGLSDLVFSPNSHAMHDVWKKIVQAGGCHEPVFISGETGAGKELVANAVFKICQAISDKRRGKRAPGSGGFLPLNIAALPAEGNLQYLELFGAEPESASGITKRRVGMFERTSEMGATPGSSQGAPGGTIFLDEIGDAAPVVQVALLRVLQEGTITPLGGFNSDSANRKVSFRLISASHSLLKNVEETKTFREDLYYRLNVIHIHLPPLRERKGDIGVLIHVFIDKLNGEYGEYGWEPKELGDAEKLVEKLSSYHWPGNVRELEMAIRSSYVTTIGNTFQLSDEVERRLAGRESSPRANADQIIESLRQKPRHYTQLVKELGEETVKELLRSLVTRFNGHLDDVTAQRYFGPDVTSDALRKWVNRKGIVSPKIERQAGSSSNDDPS
jgi:DNA-binding NtrC family response regulator